MKNCRVADMLQTLHKKMKLFIQDFFSKCDKIRRKLRMQLHLLKKSLIENFIFCSLRVFNFAKFNKICASRCFVKQQEKPFCHTPLFMKYCVIVRNIIFKKELRDIRFSAGQLIKTFAPSLCWFSLLWTPKTINMAFLYYLNMVGLKIK